MAIEFRKAVAPSCVIFGSKNSFLNSLDHVVVMFLSIRDLSKAWRSSNVSLQDMKVSWHPRLISGGRHPFVSKGKLDLPSLLDGHLDFGLM